MLQDELDKLWDRLKDVDTKPCTPRVSAAPFYGSVDTFVDLYKFEVICDSAVTRPIIAPNVCAALAQLDGATIERYHNTCAGLSSIPSSRVLCIHHTKNNQSYAMAVLGVGVPGRAEQEVFSD